MKLPEQLLIRLLADGQPMARMFVSVSLKTARKNDFGLAFGPTTDDGTVLVLRGDLLREAEKERRMFIMDYGHPEEDFMGEITVTPMNRDALKRAINAYDLYQQVTPYPRRYAEQIQEAWILLDALKPKTLTVEVEHDERSVIVHPEAVAT